VGRRPLEFVGDVGGKIEGGGIEKEVTEGSKRGIVERKEK